jgi:transposase-like protein
MADELSIGLKELLRKARMGHDPDLLKEGVRMLSQALIEMEVEEHVGAARHECSPGRVGQRNGYRERNWDTRMGTIELKVPRVMDSSYFPSLLEPRRRAERALAAVVQEAYVHTALDHTQQTTALAVCNGIDPSPCRGVGRYRTVHRYAADSPARSTPGAVGQPR